MPPFPRTTPAALATAVGPRASHKKPVAMSKPKPPRYAPSHAGAIGHAGPELRSRRELGLSPEITQAESPLGREAALAWHTLLSVTLCGTGGGLEAALYTYWRQP